MSGPAAGEAEKEEYGICVDGFGMSDEFTFVEYEELFDDEGNLKNP